MRIWLTKTSEVTIKEQLIEQITLGIASGDLLPGERLPSTRELARRFSVHPNTISSAYKELGTAGLTEFRKGSGVFVCAKNDRAKEASIDEILRKLVADATSLGYSPELLYDRLGEIVSANGSGKILILESDVSLRQIMTAEISGKFNVTIQASCIEEIDVEVIGRETTVAAMFDEREKLDSLLGLGVRRVFLKAPSIASSLNGRTRPQPDQIVAVVSGWLTFLSVARLYLIAAKVDPSSILTRSTSQLNWQRGLRSASVVICDAYAADQIPDGCPKQTFNIISEDSMSELAAAIGVQM